MEKPNNYDNFDEDYKNSIKYSVESGKYFKEAFDWYSNMYLRTIVDRTFFIFVSIIGVIIIFNTYFLITSLFPLEENIYITIRERDLTKYQTSIIDLSKSKEAKTSDEMLLEFLVTNYVKERESHNYKTANIEDMNIKLNKIKNNSSVDVFNEFRYFMGPEYQDGPYYYFGKNIESTVKINSFRFKKIERKKIWDKIVDYFNVNLTPVEAEVNYDLILQVGDQTTVQKRKAVLSFKFESTEYDKKTDKYSPVKFYVTNYKNYLLK